MPEAVNVKISGDVSGLVESMNSSVASVDKLKAAIVQMNGLLQQSNSAMASVRAGASGMGASTDVAAAGFERLDNTLRRGFADLSMVTRSISSAQTSVRGLGEEAAKSRIKLDELRGAASGIGMSLSAGVTAPMLLLGKSAFTASTDVDTMRRSLIAVTGSSALADKELSDLKEVAKLPGLGLIEAAQGAVRLQSAGMSAHDAQKSLIAFGNALATVGKGKAELDLVTLALSQMSAKGKVMGDDLRQLQEQVPQIRKVMKDAFGTADTEELQKMGITSQQFIAKVTAELGKLKPVTGGMKNEVENLKDTWTLAMNDMGTNMAPVFTKGIHGLESLTKLIASASKEFSSWSGGTQMAVLALGGLAVATGPVLIGVAKVIEIGKDLRVVYLGAAASIRAAQVAMNGFSVAGIVSKLGMVVGVAGVASVAAVAIGGIAAYVSAASRLGQGNSKDKLGNGSARTQKARAAYASLKYQYEDAGEKVDPLTGKKLKDVLYAKWQEAGRELATSKAADIAAASSSLGASEAASVQATPVTKNGKAPRARRAPAGTQAVDDAEKERETALKEAVKRDQDDARDAARIREQIEIDSIKDGREKESVILQQKFLEEFNAALADGEKRKALLEKNRSDRLALAQKWDEKEKQEAIQKRQEIMEQWLSGGQTFSAAWANEAKQRIKSVGTTYQQMARTIGDSMQSAVDGMSNGLAQCIVKGKSLSATMKDVARTVAVDMVSGIIKVGLQWVSTQVMEATFGKAMAAANLAAMAPIAAAQTALWAAPATVATIATYGGAAASAPAEIAISAAASKAQLMASFDVGALRVPSDMVARVHAGETIIPRNFAEAIRSGELTLSGRGNTTNSTTSVSNTTNIRTTVSRSELARLTDRTAALKTRVIAGSSNL